MRNTLFQFKQFSIEQDKCAMKLGTDSLLLGSLVEINDSTHILDIGTGTGILALIMAQKSIANIDAVEIDNDAFEQAKYNFNQSKWSNRLHIYHTAIQHFNSPNLYDLIICNPPYYRDKNNFSIANEKRAKARHDGDLTFDELCLNTFRLLNEDGCFWLILPTQEANEFIPIATHTGFFLSHKIAIKPKPEKDINRVIMCFGKHNKNILESTFTIYENNNEPKKEYTLLMKDFLIKL